MKGFRLMLRALLLVLLAASGSAFAVNSSHVQVVVQGTVAGSTCTAVGGSAQTVDLGQSSVSILSSSNDSWVWTNFSIALEHCPIGMYKATITFNGEPDTDNPLFYKNIAVSSETTPAAGRVAIELMAQNDESHFLSNGKSMVTVVNSVTHKAQFDLRARMITPLGRATAGIVKGHIDYTVEYQ